jgi:Holliday junction resolvase-like predicted endonuclease
MPCSECSHTLVYDRAKERLYCPACLNHPVADESQIKKKASAIREEYLNNSEIIVLLEEFGSLRVISELLHELNSGAFGIPDENRMAFNKFFTPTPIIQAVYKNWDEFDHHFDPGNTDVQDAVRDHIETLLEAGSSLIPILKQIQEDFAVAYELTPVDSDWTDFYANHEFKHTEYWLCSERCKRATVGAREEYRQQFLEQQEIFRTFRKPEKEDIDSVREFGDYWYGFIASMGFSATLDESLQDAFTTDFPDSVTIFDIEEFLSCVDNAVEDQLKGRGEKDTRSCSLEESSLDTCGKHVFGSDWTEVKKFLLVSPSNPDAHPMFFKVSGTQEKKLPNWRRSRPIQFDKILYPDFFALLLKFQIFPLLKNNGLETSKDVLDDLTAKRGLEFERNVFEYLSEQDLEGYHSCKMSKKNENEVDVIFVRDGTLYFVETKFVLPTLNMQTQRGIRDVNATFDEKVFQDGPAFDEKVDAWLDLDPGFEFTHQEGTGENDRISEEIPSEWGELDVEMLVVSNFVPSYLEKRGVRFLTDLELHQWIGDGEDVFIDVLNPTKVF